MTPLASSSDLVESSYDSGAIDGALSWATSFITGYCNRDFDLVTGDTVVVTPQSGSAQLPDYPVLAVSAVAGYLPDPLGSGMTWVTLTNFAFVPDTGLIYDTTGLPGTTWTTGYSWPWLPGSLRVTFDHGYSTVPQPLVDVCARLAQQYLENPVGLMQRRVGDEEARFSGSAGVKLNDFDRVILDQYSNVGVA